ncbi:MAG: phosphate acyltransferase PlsX [Chlamydiae bacterium]|nr:phosphate acyltransferase PlsX [Chlamydiota bacterium]
MRKLSNTNSLGREKPRIGIDLLGSDVSPVILLKSILTTYEQLYAEIDLVLFLRREDVSPLIPSSISTVLVTEFVTMDDNPLVVLRKKKNSSMARGMHMLKSKEIDAFISAGNTGALMASAKTTLKMLKGIQRPALLTLIPAKGKEVAVLDVGATTNCKPSYLLQYAQMGIAYQMSRGVEKPLVGLLNVGSEAKKGTPQHREAYLALQKFSQKFSYDVFKGNIEGRDIFEGPVDVLVTDGFTGNVFLKTAEGIAGFLLEEMLIAFQQVPSPSKSLEETLLRCKKRLDYTEYPGALLCGVDGVVIKCHGNSCSKALGNTLIEALELTRHNFLEKLKSQLSL